MHPKQACRANRARAAAVILQPTESMDKGVYRLSVSDGDAGDRLDQFLAGQCPELSRGLARKLIDIGGVHLDGRRTMRCGQPVLSGQSIDLHVDGMPLDPFRLTPEQILFRDSFLLVLDKPVGVATQPTPARYKGTLYEALLLHLANPVRRHQKPTVGMVQRLDRDTSGVMVFSIHPRAHKALTASFRDKRVRKLYLALVEGRLQEERGVSRSQLARRRASNLMVSVERGGKDAETHYRLIEDLGNASLLEVEIPTGRSHQIRAHLSEMGHPLLGDVPYGGRRIVNGVNVPRQMLHARELQFDHPVTGGRMSLCAQLPADFQRVIEQLKSSGET